ncbi:MAG: amidohydrolase [Phycisphaerae bacterium]|nr:amidohydrolase [Phycisphaerae bacterium]
MRIIDFHTHLDERWLGTPLPSRGELLDGMDRVGVAMSCIFTIQGLYGDCPRHNDALLEHAKRCPDRLIPFATVDPKEGAAAVEEARRCLGNPLFRGIKFHPWLQAIAPSMVRETMVEILRCAAEHDVPVLFHDGTPPYSTTFQVAAVARMVPEAMVVLGHAGLADYVYPAGRLIRDVPNLYGCCCGPRPGDIEYLVETGGADKILFGSDFGVCEWFLLAERLDNVLEADLPGAVMEKVLFGNAERLLRLRERPVASAGSPDDGAGSGA